MEKNIQTLLFSSLVSLREHRLICVDATPEQQFEASAAKIEKSIEDPDKLTTDVIKEIADLRVKTIEDQTKFPRLQALEKMNSTKQELLAKLPEIEKKTAANNLEWGKLKKDLTDTNPEVKKKAVEAASKLIADAHKEMGDLAAMLDLSKTDLKPLIKVREKLLAAHNKTIENVQAADPENKITLVNPATGGEIAKSALKALKEKGKEFISGTFDTLLKTFNTPGGSLDAKKVNREKIDTAVLVQRAVIYGQMKVVLDRILPYVNAEKQVDELLQQLMQMKNAVDSLTPVPEAKPDAPKPAVPAPPGKPEKAPIDPKEVAAADEILKGKGVDLKLVDALTDAKNPADQATALDALNKNTKVIEALLNKDPAASKAVVDALNTKLEATGSKLRVEVKDGKIVAKAETTITGEAERKANDWKEKLNEVLKALIAAIMEVAKAIGMSRQESNPSKVNASNAPTPVVVAAKTAAEKDLAKTTVLSKDTTAREKKAASLVEKQKLRGETLKHEARIKELTTRVAKLEQERVKCEQKDKVVDRRCLTLREEAARKGVPLDVHASPDKRSIVYVYLGSDRSFNMDSFSYTLEREFGKRAVTREPHGGRINMYNIQVGNSNVIQNQVTPSGVLAQAQSVESRQSTVEAPKAAPSIVKEAETKEPDVTIVKKTKPSASFGGQQ